MATAHDQAGCADGSTGTGSYLDRDLGHVFGYLHGSALMPATGIEHADDVLADGWCRQRELATFCGHGCDVGQRDRAARQADHNVLDGLAMLGEHHTTDDARRLRAGHL